mmetsp:Transcript_37341/g.68844  ORF Transcript_37341/g.68844 Transcript_37341/m.68844 type:complete len:275 (-) Transcript_37341:116-940(-)
MPFELTKTHQQVTSMQTGTGASRPPLGVVGTMRYVYAKHGIKGLYFGLPIAVIQTAGKVGLRFSTFAAYKRLLCKDPGAPSQAEQFVAGCAAGATEAAIWITPSERIKVLQQAQVDATRRIHVGWMSSLSLLLREQGFPGLFRGLTATVLRNGISIGIRMALYSKIRKTLVDARGGSTPRAWDPLVGGAAVGAITTVLNNPLDVVKSRMQADQQGSGSAKRFRSTWHCTTLIAAEEGATGFFRGIPARILKVSLGQAVIFFTYEHAKAFAERIV